MVISSSRPEQYGGKRGYHLRDFQIDYFKHSGWMEPYFPLASWVTAGFEQTM